MLDKFKVSMATVNISMFKYLQIMSNIHEICKNQSCENFYFCSRNNYFACKETFNM